MDQLLVLQGYWRILDNGVCLSGTCVLKVCISAYCQAVYPWETAPSNLRYKNYHKINMLTVICALDWTSIMKKELKESKVEAFKKKLLLQTV